MERWLLNSDRTDQINHTLTMAVLLGLVQQVPPPDLDKWELYFRSLRSVDRFTVTHVLTTFPAPFLSETPADTEKRNAVALVQDFYRGVANWLFHLNLGTAKPDVLRTSHWKDYRGFAKVSDFRFRLVSEIFEQKTEWQIFGTPAFLWLLCEAAVCRQMLGNSGIAFTPLTVVAKKDAVYKNNKRYMDALSIPGNPIPTYLVEPCLEKWLTLLDHQIDLKGYEMASEPDFDRMYWKPYIEARRKWSVECRRNSRLQTLHLSDSPKQRQTNPNNMGKKRKSKEM